MNDSDSNSHNNGRGMMIVVEGNISAGKSTLCRELSAILGAKLWAEPVVDNPYLDLYYKDPKGYGLKMQLWLLRHRFDTYMDALSHLGQNGGGGGVILDRSIYSDYVFAVQNYKEGNISEEGFRYYLELREQMVTMLPPPTVTLYLDVDASVCFDRIHHMRCRDCETGIGLEYLRGLQAGYLDMLGGMESRGGCVVRVPWDSFGNVRSVANRVLALGGDNNRGYSANSSSNSEVNMFMSDGCMREQVKYLDYTIAELEEDDVAAAASKSSNSGSSSGSSSSVVVSGGVGNNSSCNGVTPPSTPPRMTRPSTPHSHSPVVRVRNQ